MPDDQMPLLDTHALIWLVEGKKALGRRNLWRGRRSDWRTRIAYRLAAYFLLEDSERWALAA
jgi:PIN domain nuclease of toxin-antitoxin system